MILLYVAVVAAYLAAAWLEWRLLVPATGGSSSIAMLARWLPLLALAGHAILIARAVFTGSGLDLSLANALSAVAGLTALFAWLGAWTRALTGLTLVALPVAALGALLPLLFANPHRLSITDEPWAALHIAIALVAYALLIIAALQALLLMSFERRLHRGHGVPHSGVAPPLLTLEAFLFRLVGVGYALLTLTLVSGILFSEQLFGTPITLSQKTVFSVLGWLVFGGLLFGRHRYGWRGRVALRWVLAGSGLLLLAYVGSKFVLEVILHR